MTCNVEVSGDMKGVDAYIGQAVFKKSMKDRHPRRNDFWWRLIYAIAVFRGECDVVVWEEWAEEMKGDKP